LPREGDGQVTEIVYINKISLNKLLKEDTKAFKEKIA
jgi:hypothetical protein